MPAWTFEIAEFHRYGRYYYCCCCCYSVFFFKEDSWHSLVYGNIFKSQPDYGRFQISHWIESLTIFITLFFILEKSYLSEIRIQRYMIGIIFKFCFLINKCKHLNSESMCGCQGGSMCVCAHMWAHVMNTPWPQCLDFEFPKGRGCVSFHVPHTEPGTWLMLNNYLLSETKWRQSSQ